MPPVLTFCCSNTSLPVFCDPYECRACVFFATLLAPFSLFSGGPVTCFHRGKVHKMSNVAPIPRRRHHIMFAFAKKRMNVCHEDRRRQGDNLAPLRGCEEERTFARRKFTERNSQEEHCTKKSFEDRCLFPLCCRSGNRRILCRAAADVKRFLLGGRMTIDSRTFKMPSLFLSQFQRARCITGHERYFTWDGLTVSE